MRSVFIFAVFGMLLLLPGVSSAENLNECLKRCSTEMSSGNANCPPPGEDARTQCLQDNQEAMKHCVESCPPATPGDTPADTPKDTPLGTPKDTPDTPKEN
jgi:hypothetical protein